MRNKLLAHIISRFRWAYCQLIQLAQLRSMKPNLIDAALKKMPKTLDETYERMLSNIDEIYIDDALNFLQWLAFAQRPLTLAELAEAVAVKLSDDGNDEVETVCEEYLEDPLNILGGLVSVIPRNDDWDDVSEVSSTVSEADTIATAQSSRDSLTETSNLREITVRLAHFSVKEYLVSKRVIDSKARRFFMDRDTCDENIAQSCLAYILHYSKSVKKNKPEDVISFPLVRYAASSWHLHMSQVICPDWSRAILLLDSESSRSNWLYIYDPDDPWKEPSPSKSMGSAIYYASNLELATLVQNFLDGGADPNVQGGLYGTPLAVASYLGYYQIVKILLIAGPDLRMESGRFGYTALSRASVAGHLDVVQLLLDHEATMQAQSQPTPANQAAEKIVDGPYLADALGQAAYGGHIEIAKLLLKSGADVNAKTKRWGTVLRAAINGASSFREGRQDLFKVLLDAGAHVYAEVNSAGRNALQEAAEEGLEEVVTILLDNGAVPHDPKALCLASQRGHERVAQMLLDRGTDVNAEAEYYGNALQAASYRGQEHMVVFLIREGANVNAQCGRFGNALQAAAYGSRGLGTAPFNSTKVAQILLEEGADVDALGGRYGTALQAAASRGNLGILRLLIDSGADVHLRGGEYGTALQAAARKGHTKSVHKLLESGADSTAQVSPFGGALHAALAGGHLEVVSIILQKWSLLDKNVRDCLGRGHVHLVAAHGELHTLTQLLQNGADIAMVDNHGWTALHWAAYFGNEKKIDFLLEGGADVTKSDWQNWTAGDVALFAGYEVIAASLGHSIASSSVLNPEERPWDRCSSCGHVYSNTDLPCLTINRVSLMDGIDAKTAFGLIFGMPMNLRIG